MKPGDPLGYAALVDMMRIRAVPHWRASFVSHGSRRRSRASAMQLIEEYPRADLRGMDGGPFGHVAFALKNEGVHLGILKPVFSSLTEVDVARFVAEKPFSGVRRRLWCLYELFTGRRLGLADLPAGNYQPLLDPGEYVAPRGTESRRHRIRVNLLGDVRFCPLIRHTPFLDTHAAMRLDVEARKLLDAQDPLLVRRAVHYLYTKETRSSYAIEHEEPSSDKTERFVQVLRGAEREAPLHKRRLVEIQNAIVSASAADHDYRSEQNYVGAAAPPGYRQVIHYVAPKPDDVPELMEGWLDVLAQGLTMETVDPVAFAAAISFGFVFIHPFNDGNGRLHRYLIHYVLARRGFTPPGAIVPVSAPILGDRRAYDECLERFSEPLLGLVRYDLDSEGRMVVHGETSDLYRYLDYTAMAEYLYRCVEKAIRTDFAEELEFLAGFDRAKRGIEARVDLPERLVILFIRLCAQNHWKLSRTKRDQFPQLADRDIAELESVVKTAFESGRQVTKRPTPLG